MISSKVRDYTGDFIIIFIVHCVSVHAFMCACKGKDAKSQGIHLTLLIVGKLSFLLSSDEIMLVFFERASHKNYTSRNFD